MVKRKSKKKKLSKSSKKNQIIGIVLITVLIITGLVIAGIGFGRTTGYTIIPTWWGKIPKIDMCKTDADCDGYLCEPSGFTKRCTSSCEDNYGCDVGYKCTNSKCVKQSSGGTIGGGTGVGSSCVPTEKNILWSACAIETNGNEEIHWKIWQEGRNSFQFAKECEEGCSNGECIEKEKATVMQVGCEEDSCQCCKTTGTNSMGQACIHWMVGGRCTSTADCHGFGHCCDITHITQINCDIGVLGKLDEGTS